MVGGNRSKNPAKHLINIKFVGFHKLPVCLPIKTNKVLLCAWISPPKPQISGGSPPIVPHRTTTTPNTKPIKSPATCISNHVSITVMLRPVEHLPRPPTPRLTPTPPKSATPAHSPPKTSIITTPQLHCSPLKHFIPCRRPVACLPACLLVLVAWIVAVDVC